MSIWKINQYDINWIIILNIIVCINLLFSNTYNKYDVYDTNITNLKNMSICNCNITTQTNNINKQQKGKNNFEIIKNPDEYINKAMQLNLAFLEVKLNCVEYLNKTLSISNYNKTIYNEISKEIKIIISKNEHMLIGFMDIIQIKINLDKYLLKYHNNYKKINMDMRDFESYKNLEETAQYNLDKINHAIQYLNKTCKRIKSSLDQDYNMIDNLIIKQKTVTTKQHNRDYKTNILTNILTNKHEQYTQQQHIHSKFASDMPNIMLTLNKIMNDIENIKNEKQIKVYIPEYSSSNINLDNYLDDGSDYYSL